MLNKEDVENLDKLLTLVKSSNDYSTVDLSYHAKEGWRVNVYPDVLLIEEDYGTTLYQKKRLGELCLDRVAFLVQKKLEG